jgi:hypothetical protein
MNRQAGRQRFRDIPRRLHNTNTYTTTTTTTAAAAAAGRHSIEGAIRICSNKHNLRHSTAVAGYLVTLLSVLT